MHRLPRHERLFAAGFSAVAGYVDAVGFLLTGGFFVSFMSGNTTRAAVGLAHGTGAALFAGGLIVLFVLGVMAGALVGRFAGANRRVAVLALVIALLVFAAALASWWAPALAVVPMVLAMGAENTVFAEDGEVRIGLTYMTGTLVKLGKKLVEALMGGDRLAWFPFLLLWFGLLAGGVAGALAWQRFGGNALWGAAGLMAVLAVGLVRRERDAGRVSR